MRSSDSKSYLAATKGNIKGIAALDHDNDCDVCNCYQQFTFLLAHEWFGRLIAFQ